MFHVSAGTKHALPNSDCKVVNDCFACVNSDFLDEGLNFTFKRTNFTRIIAVHIIFAVTPQEKVQRIEVRRMRGPNVFCFERDESVPELLSEKNPRFISSMGCCPILLEPLGIEDYPTSTPKRSTEPFHNIAIIRLIGGFGLSFFIFEPVWTHYAFAAECTPSCVSNFFTS